MPKFERAMPPNEESSSGDRISGVRAKVETDEPKAVVGNKAPAWKHETPEKVESPYQTDEQLLTRGEAYKAYTARMGQINTELGDVLAASRAGAADASRRDTLIKEAEELNVWMKSVREEEAAGRVRGDLEDSELVVENPFYQKKMAESRGDTSTEEIERDFFEGRPKAQGEAPKTEEASRKWENREELQARYERLKNENDEINAQLDELRKLEAAYTHNARMATQDRNALDMMLRGALQDAFGNFKNPAVVGSEEFRTAERAMKHAKGREELYTEARAVVQEAYPAVLNKKTFVLLELSEVIDRINDAAEVAEEYPQRAEESDAAAEIIDIRSRIDAGKKGKKAA